MIIVIQTCSETLMWNHNMHHHMSFSNAYCIYIDCSKGRARIIVIQTCSEILMWNHNMHHHMSISKILCSCSSHVVCSHGTEVMTITFSCVFDSMIETILWSMTTPKALILSRRNACVCSCSRVL
ncbi:hypothetical protein H257_10873 [Aphanomyces astaci]|uniref:Uncharacterized protein n=1 Tax=Aphanomyces astaci TaxID=112090 RepID=W4G6W8_APHAT|nr:hypothetical protein H257_10873 [Aphanomyces astaci]ETV74809.1 hypothetical protein H257_10873 [Aphanomyces astaci]|eukprot:XP_009835896.1 hypothetical protein H257_10873 [Aphanomyces astaci]